MGDTGCDSKDPVGDRDRMRPMPNLARKPSCFPDLPNDDADKLSCAKALIKIQQMET